MRVTHIRPAPDGDALAYRLALALHVRHTLDAEHSSVDLTTLSRHEIKEHILGIERRTGLTTGALVHDAMPEEDSE